MAICGSRINNVRHGWVRVCVLDRQFPEGLFPLLLGLELQHQLLPAFKAGGEVLLEVHFRPAHREQGLDDEDVPLQGFLAVLAKELMEAVTRL